MIKLKKIIEGGKLFYPISNRITTEELNLILKNLNFTLKNLFIKFELAKFLKNKETHGDVDLLVLPKDNDWKNRLERKLNDNIIDKSVNGNVFSYLLRFDDINKNVHVDFIVAKDENNFKSITEYYILNDFSAVIGIFASHLNFKYGNQGFIKRYKDTKGQWHDIFITNSLMDGLRILGYKNPENEIKKINNLDDIVNFIVSSPLIDVKYFNPNNLNTLQKKDIKSRDNVAYIVDKIRKLKPKVKIEDEDYFFKKLFPELYNKIEKEKNEIEKEIYKKNKYNGKWLIDKFGLMPGPKVGNILKKLSKKFGNELNNIPEEDVVNFVEYILKNI